MQDSVGVYKAITANRLADGHVVYLTKNGKELGWSTSIEDAAIFTDSVISRMLRLTDVFIQDNIVVEPYAIEIIGKHKPLGAREEIRASRGPTIAYGSDAVASEDPEYSI
jgi:hypothetical protein